MYSRGGGWSEERVLAQRLEGESAEEASDALAVSGGGVGGAVVDVHGDDEDGDVGDEEDGHDPRHPLPLPLVLRVQRRGTLPASFFTPPFSTSPRVAIGDCRAVS